jgi:hypothetical protein
MRRTFIAGDEEVDHSADHKRHALTTVLTTTTADNQLFGRVSSMDIARPSTLSSNRARYGMQSAGLPTSRHASEPSGGPDAVDRQRYGRR